MEKPIIVTDAVADPDPWMDNGGPAFPAADRCGDHEHTSYKGMTLRDWFAGQALAGMHLFIGEHDRDLSLVVKTAYAYAAAMLKAREDK